MGMENEKILEINDRVINENNKEITVKYLVEVPFICLSYKI